MITPHCCTTSDKSAVLFSVERYSQVCNSYTNLLRRRMCAAMIDALDYGYIYCKIIPVAPAYDVGSGLTQMNAVHFWRARAVNGNMRSAAARKIH